MSRTPLLQGSILRDIFTRTTFGLLYHIIYNQQHPLYVVRIRRCEGTKYVTRACGRPMRQAHTANGRAASHRPKGGFDTRHAPRLFASLNTPRPTLRRTDVMPPHAVWRCVLSRTAAKSSARGAYCANAQSAETRRICSMQKAARLNLIYVLKRRANRVSGNAPLGAF